MQTAVKRKRGRPRGTGIDDRQRLETIAATIAANPGMRPTTAIRAIGIADPSVIRRLRDKFKAWTRTHPHEVASSHHPVAQAPRIELQAALVRTSRSAPGRLAT